MLRWEAWCAPGDTWTAAHVPKMVSFSLPSDRPLSWVPLLTPSATQRGRLRGSPLGAVPPCVKAEAEERPGAGSRETVSREVTLARNLQRLAVRPRDRHMKPAKKRSRVEKRIKNGSKDFSPNNT